MTSTTYLELEDQATGANNNTWGDVADSNFSLLELAIARFATVSTTGGSTTLTSSQNRYPIIKITGALVSNATIIVRTAEKNWRFINGTTGNFTVTVKTLAGTGKTLPRGRAVQLYCDGTNVEHARVPGVPQAQAAGTVDAITATFEPATTSAELQDGMLWIVEAAGANTSTTPTFNPDSLGAMTIKKNGGQALAAGDIRAAGHKLLLCYDATDGHVELLNPNFPTFGTAAQYNVGTAANNIVQLDGSAKLPAVDASQLTNIPSLASVTIVTAAGSSNFTLPNCTMVFVRLWAAGGSGAVPTAGNPSNSTGGGGGAYFEKLYRRSDLGAVGASIAYTVGAGGPAQTVAGSNGVAGGNTTFSSGATLATAYGGGPGNAGTAVASGGSMTGAGVSGSASGTIFTQGASAGADAAWPWNGASSGGGGASNTNGGNAYLGGAGGGGTGTPSVGTGGTSTFGGNGGAAANGSAATAGSAPGGGGGGCKGGGTSGKGGDGRLEIYCW